MPHPPSPNSDIVVVTTHAKLAGLIDDAVERAVRRALAEVRADRTDANGWLPTHLAVKAYGRSRSTLYRWRAEGRVRSEKIGGSVYFARPGAGEAITTTSRNGHAT